MPILPAGRARELLAAAPVARLATVRADGSPHLVPITFALLPGDVAVFAVDHKPKTTTRLARIAHLERDPRVSLLADHYADDWTTLWWVRLDGSARVLTAGESSPALAALAGKYRQYREVPPAGPVVAITATGWRGWTSSL